MLKLGIIGYPLEHSLSPLMHSTALQYLNIDGEYKVYEIKENEFEDKIKELIKNGIKGFNVTIPYKTKIISLLDELTSTAKLVGAVNTVNIENGKMIGDNTDVIGFWEPIPENIKKSIQNKQISILGCGGAARAACFVLIQNGVKKIKVFGRNTERLSDFKKLVESQIEIDLLRNIDLSKTEMLINTTPIGMYPNIIDSVVSIDNLKKLPTDAFVYDIIYNPQETKLLKDAKSLGLKTINGIEMLIRQGAASLGIWLEQKEMPIGAMRLAMNQVLSFKF